MNWNSFCNINGRTINTAVLSEAWAKLCKWAILAGKGRLLLSGSVVLASLKAAVYCWYLNKSYHIVF